MTDRVVLATATNLAGDLPSGVCDLAQPGTTMVFYMAMRQLDALINRLLAAGVASTDAVTVATNVLRPDERRLQTTIARMAADCRASQMRNPAVITMEVRGTPGGNL